MSRRNHLLTLRSAAPAIMPSLLLCDFSNLEREVGRLEEAGVAALHLDVMDGVFVPNLTYGMPIVEACRRLTDLPLDVHLMISDPCAYLQAFYDAGADSLTVHVEAVEDAPAALQAIQRLGMGAGIALNPGTPLARIESCWGFCDSLLVMGVQAGFGGQAFQPVALEKMREARSRGGPDLLVAIDGGVNASNIGACAEAGADLYVIGSAIFRQSDYRSAVADLRQRAKAADVSSTKAALRPREPDIR